MQVSSAAEHAMEKNEMQNKKQNQNSTENKKQNGHASRDYKSSFFCPVNGHLILVVLTVVIAAVIAKSTGNPLNLPLPSTMKTSPAFLFLAPLLGLASAAAPSCSRDEDCSLNGICNNATSRCTCDPGWRGTDCGILDLAPAPRKGNGYNMTSTGTSSWCNQIVRDPRNKSVHHLFLSEFTHGCSLDYWTPYSRIIRAESTDGPAGPYVYRDEIVPAFAHNPSVVYSPVDEAYFLYYVGCKTEVNAEKCETKEFTCGPGNEHNGESGISAMISKDLITWEHYGQVMKGVDDKSGRLWDADVTNPGAFALPNGELAMAFRGCPFNCDVGKEWIGLAIGNTPRGTFHKVSAEAPLFSEYSEDPFIWQDKRGNWHLLVHSLEADGGFDGQPHVGRHAYAPSLEGPWTFNNKTVAYTTTVDFDDGSQIVYHRRERPQLLFTEDGSMRPLYLTNGVQEKGTHASYSLVQPIKGA